MPEDPLLQIAAILVLGVAGQWLAWRLRFPSILALLIGGFVAGPVAGFVDPDELFGSLLIPVVSLSVGVILFEGGLSLRSSDLPHVGGAVRNLLLIGGGITWAAVSAGAYLIAGLDLSVAVLLGAILVVTGPTVVGPLLEHVRPTGRVGPILRWEGIVIDPIGAMLAVLVFEGFVVESDNAALDTAWRIFRTLGIGGGIGLASAGLMVLAIRRYWVPDGLQNPMTLMVLVAAITLSDEVQNESGLFTATIMGIALANQKIVSVGHIVEFKENLRVLIIASLFIVLAARIPLDEMRDAAPEGLALLGVVLLTRPLAVWASVRSGLAWNEKLFLSAIAPRGIVAAAVSSVFALRLAEEGHADAGRLVPLAFIVIIGTIVVYGLGAAPVARWLKLSGENPQGAVIVGAHPWARRIAQAIKEAGFPVLVVDTNWKNISDAKLAGLPAYYGSVLSEQAHDELDLTGIGKLLAMTPNDEVNSLAAQRFAYSFGRQNVFQLAPKGTGRTEALGPEQRGRIMFAKELGFATLADRFESGAVIRATTLSDEFGWEHFEARHGEKAVPLFAVPRPGRLQVVPADSSFEPRSGQTVISLLTVDDDASASPAPDAEEQPTHLLREA